MMNFFEQQLRKLVKDAGFTASESKFIGRAAFLQMQGGRCARIEFEALGTCDEFEAVRVTILDKAKGKIDSQRLRFGDYFSADSRGLRSFIWINRGEAEWYVQPSPAEWRGLAKAVNEYVFVFE